MTENFWQQEAQLLLCRKISQICSIMTTSETWI